MTIYYRPHKPERKMRIPRISDRAFWTGVGLIGSFSAGALYSAYLFFVG